MKILVDTVIGGVKYQYEIEEKDEIDTLHKAIVLANPLKTCNNCKTVGYDTKYLTTNKSTTEKGTFTYINCKCSKCGARSRLGQYKTGGYFWTAYELYKKPGTKAKTGATPEEAESIMNE